MFGFDDFDMTKASKEYLEANKKAKEMLKRPDVQKDIEEISKKFDVPRDIIEHDLEAGFRQKFLKEMPNVPDIWKNGYA